jgi:pyruvate dehydrogenase E1 component alpha subunit
MGFKMRGAAQVAVSFFGDGAANQGGLYESMNIAALWGLPVVYVCENNGYAVDTSVERGFAVPEIAARAAPFGVPGVVVDGTDVIQVYEVSKHAVERARSGEGPTFLEIRAPRICGHFTADPQWYYRTKKEVEACELNCPIDHLRGQLMERSILTEEQDEELRQTIRADIEDAVRFAHESPWPGKEDLHDHLYAVNGEA